jgi:general secretion pathway protein N
MKSALRYTALGVMLYLLFLVALFPAGQAYRFAAEPLQRALPQLKLAGLEGSIWSGHVESLVYRQALLGEMSWQLSPLSLLFGRAQLKALLQSREGYLQSRIRTPLGGGHVELADIEGRMPMSELSRFAPYVPVVLEGAVSLDLTEAEVAADGRLLRAQGRMVWHQAAISAPQALSFGDLQLVLHTEEEGRVSGELSDRGGPLKVAGTLNLEPDRSYRLSANVAATPQAPPVLVQSLGLLGKPDAQGRYRIHYRGRL